MKKHIIYWNGNYYYFLFNDEHGNYYYFLFNDEQGIKYYLNHPSWDCGWYWGFGYITTFSNNRNPEKSKDIGSHQHFGTLFGHNHLHWMTDENIIIYPVLNPGNRMGDDRWQMHELFAQFYHLRKMAEFSAKKPIPGMHLTTSSVNHGNMDQLAAHINQNMIPAVMHKIISMLTPEGEEVPVIYMGSSPASWIDMDEKQLTLIIETKQ